MRILVITDTYRRRSHVGGGDLIGQKLNADLSARGHTVAIATSGGGSYPEEREPGVHRIFLRNEDLRKRSRRQMLAELEAEQQKLDALVADFEPDVLLALQHGQLAVPVISYINALAIPKVYRVGGDWLLVSYFGRRSCPYSAVRYPIRGGAMALAAKLPNFPPAHRFYPRLPFQAECVIFNSRHLLNRHRSVLGNISKSVVIRNGVDGEQFSFQERKLGQPLRLLFVGRLTPRKGAHLLADVLAQVRAMEGLSETTLTLVGAPHTPHYLDGLKQRFAAHGLTDAVKHISVVPHDKLSEIYNNHDLLVFSSLRRKPHGRGEGCPSVVLEAMACGLPIVAHVGADTEEILKAGENCHAAKGCHPTDLARGIETIARDAQLYASLQEQGRAYVEEYHAPYDMMSAIEQQLHEAMLTRQKSLLSV